MSTVHQAPLEAAKAAYRSGDFGAAAIVLQRLVEGSSQDAVATQLLGLCHLKQGDTSAALTLLERAVALAPREGWPAMHLAMALQAAGRAAEAVTLLRRAAGELRREAAPLVNLAGALLAVGDVAAAIAAGQEACRRVPRLCASHYALGQALLAARDWTRAEAAFDSALRLAPGFADAWVNLGLAHYHLGRIGAAKASMRRALDAAPGHRAALANLTAFQRLTGEAAEAEVLLAAALVQDPAAVGLRLNLTGMLLQEDRAGEALDLLAGAPPPGLADNAFATLQRVLALLQLGRASEAAALLAALGDVPPDLAPLKSWRELLLALALGDAGAARASALEMEATLEADAILPEHAIMARFDLAKFWAAQREPRRAFASWTAGHARLAHFQPFSREHHLDFVDACIDVFSRRRLAGGVRATDQDATPVFIVGMPRSGTTLAEQILDAHSQVFGAGERIALSQAFHRLSGGVSLALAPQRIADCATPALDAVADPYLRDLHALSPGAKRIVDKMPGNFLYLGAAALLLPGARIIHCVRDPRDIGLSIFTFRFHGQHGYAHDLADLGWYIGQQSRLMDHWKAVLPNPILTLGLSDWIDDFDATLRRVLAFVDLPHEEACTRFHESEARVRTVSRHQVRQPINARGLGRWKAHAEDLAPLIRELEAAGVDMNTGTARKPR